jgi:hypothetical protein
VIVVGWLFTEIVRDGSVGTIMLIASDCDEEVFPLLSRTLTVKRNVPVAVGVPAMAPVEVLSDKPPGNEPELTVQALYGGTPPDAARVDE